MNRPWTTLRRAGLALALGTALAACLAPAVAAQSEFPFGRELLLDARPMKGSKRVPILDVVVLGVLFTLMAQGGAVWRGTAICAVAFAGTVCWLIERRRIGPVIRELRSTTDPLFRQAGISLDKA